jgi:asparagine synthase (glutamine-hydrolysing)
MCGIAGIVEAPGQSVEESRLRAMAGSMAHRGPDDEGITAHGQGGLAHRRLSILDVSANGRQPMSNADETVWIAFNGEIYNFAELRERLPQDPPYRSESDTEVLLRAYETWGPDCLHELNGMFAFAILDLRKNEIFIARDRIGIKPLYYADDGTRFYFASEVKAIVAAGLKPEFNRIAAVDFAYSGLTSSERHFFRHVKRIPPGHCLNYSMADGSYSLDRYYQPKPDWSYVDALGTGEGAWTDKVEEMLSDAIDSRLVSDVPVGTYCSGGIDSSLITAMTAKKHDNLFACNVAMADSPDHDEGPMAQRVADHVGAKLHTFQLTREAFRKAFVQTVFITEYPLSFVNSVPLYLVSQLARDQGIRVLLSGEGADELFGGYVRRFRPNALRRVAQSKGSLFNWAFNQGIGVVDRVNKKLGMSVFDPKGTQRDFHRILAGNMDATWTSVQGRDIYERYEDPLDRELAQTLWLQLQAYLLPILHRTDRASMTASVEARVPFLDHRMVEFALAVPPKYKCGVKGFRPVGKSILKKVAARYLPHDVVYQQKMGFEVPRDYYAVKWPKEWIHEGFVSQTYQVAPERLAWWLEGNTEQSLAWMLSFEVWGQLFIRGRSVDDVTADFLKVG